MIPAGAIETKKRKKTLLTAVLFGLGADIEDSNPNILAAVNAGFYKWIYSSGQGHQAVTGEDASRSIQILATLFKCRINYTFREKQKIKILTYPKQDLSTSTSLKTIWIASEDDGCFTATCTGECSPIAMEDNGRAIVEIFFQCLLEQVHSDHFFQLLSAEEQQLWQQNYEDQDKMEKHSEDSIRSNNSVKSGGSMSSTHSKDSGISSDVLKSGGSMASRPLMVINKSIPVLFSYKDFIKAHEWTEKVKRFFNETQLEHIHPATGIDQTIYPTINNLWRNQYSESIERQSDRAKWFMMFLNLLRDHLKFVKSAESIQITSLKNGTLDFDDLQNQVEMCVLATDKDEYNRLSISQDRSLTNTIVRKIAQKYSQIGGMLEHKKEFFKDLRYQEDMEDITSGRVPESLMIYERIMALIAIEFQHDNVRLETYKEFWTSSNSNVKRNNGNNLFSGGGASGGSRSGDESTGNSNNKGNRNNKNRKLDRYKMRCLQCDSEAHLLKDCPNVEVYIKRNPNNRLVKSILSERGVVSKINDNSNNSNNNASSNRNNNDTTNNVNNKSNAGRRSEERDSSRRGAKKISKLRK